jgi:hypothetical protein
LKPLEVDLKRLEDLSDAIVQDFAVMRKREEEMRDTNGKLMGVVSRFWMLMNRFSLSRINQQSSIILQYIQHVLSAGFGHMAGTVPAKILQGEKIDRIRWNYQLLYCLSFNCPRIFCLLQERRLTNVVFQRAFLLRNVARQISTETRLYILCE